MALWETLDAVSRQLELCGIDSETAVVALLPEHGQLTDVVRAAIIRSGADAVDVRPLARARNQHERVDQSPLMATLTADADIVIDACQPGHVSEPPQGVRVLRLLPATVDAHRYPPHINLRRRVTALEHLLAGATTVHITDHHGTDLRIGLDAALIVGDSGCPEPGSVATYPSGTASITPAADRVAGELIVMPGDANLTRGLHLGSPVRLELVDDRIVTIDGDNADADTLRALFEGFNHHDPYGFATLTIGINAGGSGTLAPFAAELVDPDLARCHAGTITLSFGANLHADRPCPGLIELALARRSIAVDNTSLVVDGTVQGDIAPDIYEQAE